MGQVASSIFLLLTTVAFILNIVRIDVKNPGQFCWVYGGSQACFDTTNHWMLAWFLQFPIILLMWVILYASMFQSNTLCCFMRIGNTRICGYPGLKVLYATAVVGLWAMIILPSFSDSRRSGSSLTSLSWFFWLHLANFAFCILCGLEIIKVQAAHPLYNYGYGHGYPYQPVGLYPDYMLG